MYQDSVLNRFWEKVDQRGPGDCWNWTASTNRGYGKFRIGNTMVGSHRIAYFIEHGELPLKNSQNMPLSVCHHCDNKLCCNPRHLFLGTQFDNMHDASIKGIMPIGENHGKSKLTEAQVVLIKLMLHKKIPQRSIAKDFNVTQTAINFISTGRTWSHVNYV